ncbi:antibiotic biosynthesis monooxygenase [Amphiplicatus metriothermophilus]|uniref:Antibiotic biosynthesis monooxygenase n=1 Tax=Amphiplicatus metriothermophilus TaxID=1519374 RepID=A0A239PIZ4_9PROT|nr:antibiotic biosynthesis monooxygenase [Amphiplicatus metriothermophilus]MBB5518071.1 heme-degrading monooxygenase HmoA [Amphiplicatus metriothermophilus]SNT67595.1 Antibiotic biosynthesis monooxygenase [Amphiplicatus metriothermophilus]
MTVAYLYRWRVAPGKERAFEVAWAEGTRLMHEKCGSYGARLHRDADGVYWSYALWPDEETRRRCVEESGVMNHESFRRMRAAVIDYLGETALAPRVDLLAPPARDRMKPGAD